MNIMKKPALFIIFFSLLFNAVAQSDQVPGYISIIGKIKDSVTRLALEKATVRVISRNSGYPKKQTLSDNNGSFYFSGLLPGKYDLVVNFIGYQAYSQSILLNRQDTNVVIKDVLMAATGKLLQAVVVTGTKLLVENKIDRIVYNVDKDITSQGGVATDILKKIPEVSVDINGNVELLGNSSIRFLINGKPSTIFGNSIADAL